MHSMDQNQERISLWHELPLFAVDDDCKPTGALNFICEMCVVVIHSPPRAVDVCVSLFAWLFACVRSTLHRTPHTHSIGGSTLAYLLTPPLSPYKPRTHSPKFTRRKFEIATNEAGNPIKQDEKNGKPRVFSKGDIFFNYGCFPRTWEVRESVRRFAWWWC